MSQSQSRINLRYFFHGITAGYLFLTALIVALGFTTFRMSKVGTEHSAELSDELLPSLQAMARLQSAVLKYNLANQEYVTARDDETMARKLDEARELRQQIQANEEEIAVLIEAPQAHELRQSIDTALAAYDDANTRLQAALAEAEFEKAMAILDGDIVKTYGSLESAVESMGAFVFGLANQNGSDTRETVENNLSTTLLLGSVIGGIALLCVVVVQVLAIRVRGRFGRLSSGLGVEASDILEKAGNFNRSSVSLAERANQQAASLEESSASLEEMAGMTKRNAEAAQHAKEIAGATREAVDAGSTSMQRMASTMEEIRSSSAEISKIIKTIDEIAFQTNILALNAAVEAARAGEAGAGFAVVADEVRNLAQRSAKAARETADQIDGAVKKSEEGAAMSGEVLQMLTTIVEKVRQMDTLVVEIANASEEQSQGVSQVTRAVSEMDAVTQSNAATAEESASAAHELSTQASDLKQMVLQLRSMVGNADASEDSADVPSSAFAAPATSSASPRRGSPARQPAHFA